MLFESAVCLSAGIIACVVARRTKGRWGWIRQVPTGGGLAVSFRLALCSTPAAEIQSIVLRVLSKHGTGVVAYEA